MDFRPSGTACSVQYRQDRSLIYHGMNYKNPFVAAWGWCRILRMKGVAVV